MDGVEAARLLWWIIERLHVSPLSDGSVRCSFEGDAYILDRLAAFLADHEDLEDDGTGEEAERDGEDDMRDLPEAA